MSNRLPKPSAAIFSYSRALSSVGQSGGLMMRIGLSSGRCRLLRQIRPRTARAVSPSIEVQGHLPQLMSELMSNVEVMYAALSVANGVSSPGGRLSPPVTKPRGRVSSSWVRTANLAAATADEGWMKDSDPAGVCTALHDHLGQVKLPFFETLLTPCLAVPPIASAARLPPQCGRSPRRSGPRRGPRARRAPLSAGLAVRPSDGGQLLPAIPSRQSLG